MAKKTALQIITATAKQIRRKQPARSWKAAILEASAIYRRSPAAKLSGVKTKSKPAKKSKPAPVDKRKIKPKQRGKPDNTTQSPVEGWNKKKDQFWEGAKPPGLRKSAAGNWYYERRKNRSDQPGKLTGIIGAASFDLVRERINMEVKQREDAKRKILQIGSLLRNKPTPAEKKQLKKAIEYYRKEIRSCTTSISNLKKMF